MKTYNDLVAEFAEKYYLENRDCGEADLGWHYQEDFKKAFNSAIGQALVQGVARLAWTDGNNYQLSLEGRDRLARGICPIQAWWQEFTKEKE